MKNKLPCLYIFSGKVRLSLDSPSAVKFINRCKEHRLRPENIKQKDNITQFSLSAPNLIKAKRMGLTKSFRIRIIKKYGILRNLRPLQKRPVFFLGSLFCALFLAYMSGFIWNVSIGDGQLNSRDISTALYGIGLKTGTPKKDVDNERIKNLMLLHDDRLGWLAVNVSGCTAKIDYSLKNLTPELIAKTDPCDVVASKTAVIKAVNNYKGTQVIKNGETVTEGDVLISSVVRIGNDYSREYIYHNVHARGEVYGRTWYSLKAYSSALVRIKMPTQENKLKVYFKFDKKRVNLPFGYRNYSGDCDIIIKEYALGFGSALCIETLEPYLSQSTAVIEKETSRLRESITDTLNRSMDSGVIVASEFRDESDGQRNCVQIVCECIEQIGIPKPITTTDSGS